MLKGNAALEDAPYHRYYGLYEAVVTRNDDPEGLGRVQALCVEVGQDQAPNVWIKPAFSSAGQGRGEFWPPEKNDFVWVSFDRGLPDSPRVYMGGRVGVNSDVETKLRPAPKTAPTARGFVTRMGHKILFEDAKDNEFIRIIWHKSESGDAAHTDKAKSASETSGDFAYMGFEANGDIIIANKNGSMVRLCGEEAAIQLIDEAGNSISTTSGGISIIDKSGQVISTEGGKINISTKGSVNITAAGINLNAGGVNVASSATAPGTDQPSPKGLDLITWLASHIHPTALGPSGPSPQAAALPSILSKNTKVK